MCLVWCGVVWCDALNPFGGLGTISPSYLPLVFETSLVDYHVCLNVRNQITLFMANKKRLKSGENYINF